MKKNSKKLIALLSVACVATAAAAFAGCDKEESKSAYEIAKQQGWFTGTEEEFKNLLHVHTYGDDIEVVVAPTGESDGLGYKVCEADGHKEYVVLAKLAGVIASNPIEIAVGETKTVTLNTYDGANTLVSGEKNVMYFKTTVDKTGYIAMPTNVPEGVEVEYSFYYADSYTDDDMMGSRNVWVDETDETAKQDVYVKMAFKSVEVADGETAVEVPATVDVTVQHTDLSNEVDAYAGKIKHTIKLSQGTASELKVYTQMKMYGQTFKYAVTLFKDGQVEEGSIGDYKAFDGTDTATVWLEPGEYVFEIEGLADGFCLANEDECVITLPDDGSKDKDCEYSITVGKSYTYTFTVTDTADAVIENANVIVLDAEGEQVAFGTTNAQGKVELVLDETLNEEGALGINYSVVVENLGFGNKAPDAVELTADAKEVTIKAVAADVEEWSVGTEYMVFAAEPVVYATVNLAAAGNYDVVLSCSNMMFSYSNYEVNVNGQSVSLGDPTGWDLATELKATFAMTAGVNKIGITSSNSNLSNYTIKASVVAATTSGGSAPAGTALVLGANNNITDEIVYNFTATEAGSYTFTFEGLGEYDSVAFYTEAAWDSWGAAFYDSVENGTSYTKEFTAGESLVFVVDYNSNSLNITVAAGGSSSAGNTLVVGMNSNVTDEVVYTFTAEVAGSYTFTFEGLGEYDGVAFYTESAWDSWGAAFYDSVENGTSYTKEFTAGESLVFVVDYNSDSLNITVANANER